MSSLLRRPANLFVLLLLSVLLFGGFATSTFTSRAWSNWGWVMLARHIYATNNSASALTGADAIGRFNRAVALDKTNQSAYLGAGIQSARLLDEQNAQSYWQQGQIYPPALINRGQLSDILGQKDLALLYYRSAAQISDADADEAQLLAGRVCQTERTGIVTISDANTEYCTQYFEDNGANLILDGQFDYPMDWGWTGSFSFVNTTAREVSNDAEQGVAPPSLRTTGKTDARHGGLYQRIALDPGTTVRFGGWFQIATEDEMEAWLLYIGWRQDGVSQGRYFAAADTDMDWSYLEWEFTLPMNSEPFAQFYPVLLIGQGAVWSDGISVETLSR